MSMSDIKLQGCYVSMQSASTNVWVNAMSLHVMLAHMPAWHTQVFVEGRSAFILLKHWSLVSQEARVRPDVAVWNALIAAAGRAGQLQRALEALQDMQACL